MQIHEHSTDDDRMVENVLETLFKNLSSNNPSLYLIHFKKQRYDNKWVFMT